MGEPGTVADTSLGIDGPLESLPTNDRLVDGVTLVNQEEDCDEA